MSNSFGGLKMLGLFSSLPIGMNDIPDMVLSPVSKETLHAIFFQVKDTPD